MYLHVIETVKDYLTYTRTINRLCGPECSVWDIARSLMFGKGYCKVPNARRGILRGPKLSIGDSARSRMLGDSSHDDGLEFVVESG